MEFARITSAAAREALFPLVDDDIMATTVAEDAAAEAAEIDALIEQALGPDFAEIDALIDEAEREFEAAEQVETFRVSRELTDQVRARRTARRATREALRSALTLGSLQSAGKTATLRALLSAGEEAA
ncbi:MULTISPECIES: hypothetical protein [Amycolatopsis]|uniref:Uncharacterized protein n=1 Tax=Amycolatopsis tucumanensis TaxID=401106 RepID=A0ABP7J1Y7_9PSEU|nr:hypothetical protein [Amycolatopsis tucumanensis]MCF6422227.1 hypothetical protein [Amycolatopsis tucumanensis]